LWLLAQSLSLPLTHILCGKEEVGRMLEPLLWIVGAYTGCILIVHAAHAWKVSGSRRGNGKKAGQPFKHVVLVTHNEQHRIEWVLRSLLLVSWLKGKEICFTVLDQSSSDDTLSIVERLARKAAVQWRIVSGEEELRGLTAFYREQEALLVDRSEAH